MATSDGLIRIGELSRRVSVSVDRLRAWERRYGLLKPARTPGGFRLYSHADEQRVRAMQQQLETGVSAAEAARMVLGAEARQRGGEPHTHFEHLRHELGAAVRDFDTARAHAVVDRSFAEYGPNDAMRHVIFPYLHDVGEGWARARIDVGQEHFASNLLQGRLLSLLRGRNAAAGPVTLLACPPGELHSLGLIGFGIALRNRGWRTTYLGTDTPIATVQRIATELSPSLVVLAAMLPMRFADVETELRDLAANATLALAGAGAVPALAERVGAQLLDTDPITAGERIAQD
jgi:DNA-binding transcriptional MerR regulator